MDPLITLVDRFFFFFNMILIVSKKKESKLIFSERFLLTNQSVTGFV